MTARRPDFVAGNTRLRARLPGVLAPDRVEQWGDLDLEALEGRLRGLPGVRFTGTGVRTGTGVLTGAGAGAGAHSGSREGRPDVVPRSPGDRRHALLLAVEAGQREAQRAAVAAYSGTAHAAVAALLTPQDVADVVTLVRAVARGLVAEEVTPLVHAVGSLTPALLREVISDDPAVTVSRLVDRRWPYPAVAAQVRDGGDAFARTEDLAAWEAAVARAVWRVRDAELASMGASVRPIRNQLALVRDEVNLIAALRARSDLRLDRPPGQRSDARPEGPAASGHAGFLPAGTLGRRELDAIAGGAHPAPRVPAPWRPLVERLDGGRPAPPALSELARALEQARLQAAAALVRSADPLGAGLPVGYLARLELQARALRAAVERADEPASATSVAGAA